MNDDTHGGLELGADPDTEQSDPKPLTSIWDCPKEICSQGVGVGAAACVWT